MGISCHRDITWSVKWILGNSEEEEGAGKRLSWKRKISLHRSRNSGKREN